MARQSAGPIFTCANSWNGRKRASCTMQNRSIITRGRIWSCQVLSNPKHCPPRKHTMSNPNSACACANVATRHSTFHRNLPLLLSACTIAFCLVAHPGTAWAKRSASENHTSAGTPTKKKGVSKVTYQRSTSEESRAEHDRRMYRECKGMHNAGACRGYTSK
jgi:hypothetical protein